MNAFQFCNIHLIYHGGVALQLILILYDQLQKSGIEDENQKKMCENVGSITTPQQDVVHPSLSGSRSQPDLGLG